MKNDMKAAALAAIDEAAPASVNTTLGLVGGEVLLSLQTLGPVAAREVADKLDWPAEIVYMAIGSLIRRRMIGAAFQKGEVHLHLFKREEKRAPSTIED